MKKTRVVFLALLLGMALLAACDQIGVGVESTDAPAAVAMFRSNPQRTGVYDSAPLERYETTKWQFQAEDWIFGAPAVVGDTVIAVSYDSNVYALDRETGAETWRFKTGGSILASPAVSGGLVFVASEDKLIYALDLATGEKKWQAQGEGVYSGSPAVVGDIVYFNSDTGLLLALDTATGKELWRHQTNNDATPFGVAVDNGIVYTVGGSGVLYALDAATGEEQWQYDADKGMTDNLYSPTAAPVVNGNMVYLTFTDINSGTVMQAFDLTTQTVKWSNARAAETYSAPSIAGNVLVQGGLDFKIHGLDAATGEPLWEAETGGIIFSAAAVTGNVAYIGSTDRTLYGFDTRTGEILWRFPARGGVSSPVISDGVVYVGDDAGTLYAIK